MLIARGGVERYLKSLCSTSSAVLVVNRPTTDRVVSRSNPASFLDTAGLPRRRRRRRVEPPSPPWSRNGRGKAETAPHREINKGTTKPFNYRGPEINSNGTTVFRGPYGNGSLIGRVIRSGAFQTEQLFGSLSLSSYRRR